MAGYQHISYPDTVTISNIPEFDPLTPKGSRRNSKHSSERLHIGLEQYVAAGQPYNNCRPRRRGYNELDKF